MESKIPKEFKILSLHRYRGTAGKAFDDHLDGPSLRGDLLLVLGRAIQQRNRRVLARRFIEMSLASAALAGAAFAINVSRFF